MTNIDTYDHPGVYQEWNPFDEPRLLGHCDECGREIYPDDTICALYDGDKIVCEDCFEVMKAYEFYGEN